MGDEKRNNDSKETKTVYTDWQIDKDEEQRKKKERDACLAKGDKKARSEAKDRVPILGWIRKLLKNNVSEPVGAIFDGSTAHQHNTESDAKVAGAIANSHSMPMSAGVVGTAIGIVSEDNSISNSRKNAAGMGVVGVNKLSTNNEYIIYYNEEQSLGRQAMSRDEWEKEKGEEYRQSLSVYRNKNRNQDDCFSTLWREDPATRAIRNNLSNNVSNNDPPKYRIYTIYNDGNPVFTAMVKDYAVLPAPNQPGTARTEKQLLLYPYIEGTDPQELIDSAIIVPVFDWDKGDDKSKMGTIDPNIRKDWMDLYRKMLIRPRDPLTLDLDGNGIETIASNGHDGALFDHSNDGIRTATGWINKNDGFLVYDRNGDGVINNGSELFGDNTLLKNGERATNGYQALAELDDNGDGKVDTADSAFAKLRVWRDLNQDGISQEGELLTLEEAKVKALNLAHKNSDRDLGNGNTLAEEGTYTDSDGNEKQMGDLNLAADPFHSRFSDNITLTDEQQQAPNLRGSGRVRDLREAAAQSPDVAAALQAYANAQTKEEQLALRDQLLRAWAGTDKRFTTEGVLEAASTKTFTMTNKGNAIPLTPGELKALGTIEGPDIWSLLGIEDPEKKKKAALREKIGILDAFTGTDSTHLYYGTKAQAQHTLDTIEKTYANLADNLYDGLLFQTRLKPYLDAIRFGMDDAGKLQLDYSGVAELFDEVHAKNPGKAFTDLGELLAKGNADGKNTDMALLAEKLVQYAQEASNNGTFEAYSNTLGKEALSVLGRVYNSSKYLKKRKTAG